MFTIGLNNAKSEQCKSLEKIDNHLESFQNKIKLWEQNILEQFKSIEKLQTLSEGDCVRDSFLDNFYADYEDFHSNISTNEQNIIAKLVDLLSQLLTLE